MNPYPNPNPLGGNTTGEARDLSLAFIPLAWGPFLESPGNLPGPISDFGDECFSTEVNFY